MEHFRLAVSLECETTHYPCTTFIELASGFLVRFGSEKVLVPPSLLRSGDISPRYSETALTKTYGAVPQVCSFQLQVTEPVFQRELDRRAGEDEGALSPRGWHSLSPRPAPRSVSPELVFQIDEDMDDCIPQAGRFGLWTVGAFDIDADCRPPSPGQAHSLDSILPRTASPPPTDFATAHIAWTLEPLCNVVTNSVDEFDVEAAKIDGRKGSFIVVGDELKLQCSVESAPKDGRFALYLTEASLFVPKTAKMAKVFAGTQ